MKKGIVMEKHPRFTIVMTPDGNIYKVKPVKEAEIGAEVHYEFIDLKKGRASLFQSKKGSIVKYIAVACIIMLFVVPFYFLGGQNKTYAYVNLNINPSLEIEIDKDLRVVSINPLNDDAKTLMQQLSNYEDKQIEQVIEIIMDKSDALELTENGKNILIGVSYVNSQDVSVLNSIDHYFKTHHTSWEIATFQVPKKIRERAIEKNIPMNRLMAKLMNNSDMEVDTKTRASDDEKELIYSFYTNSKSNHQNSEWDNTISAENGKPGNLVSPPEQGKSATDVHSGNRYNNNNVMSNNGDQQRRVERHGEVAVAEEPRTDAKALKREVKEGAKEVRKEPGGKAERGKAENNNHRNNNNNNNNDDKREHGDGANEDHHEDGDRDHEGDDLNHENREEEEKDEFEEDEVEGEEDEHEKDEAEGDGEFEHDEDDNCEDHEEDCEEDDD